MLVTIRHDQGDSRAGARTGPLILGREELIPLEGAVALVWGKSAAKKPESRQAHTSILELFATRGLDGVILETTVKWKKWYTSREAVERFMARTFGRGPQSDSHIGERASRPRRAARQGSPRRSFPAPG
jgi:hypothetical protein